MGIIDMYKRNFKLASFAKFALVVLLIGLLVGCTHKETQESFMERRSMLQDYAVDECLKHGQAYVTHHTVDLEEWNVICVQDSPIKFFHYILV